MLSLLPRLPVAAAAALPRALALLLVICTAVALLLTVMGRGGFGTMFIYSLSIGSFCWIFINGGHAIATAWLERRLAARGLAAQRTARRVALLVFVVLGMPAGTVAGSALADLLTGNRSPSLLHLGATATQVTLLVSLLTTLVFVAIGYLREGAEHARAQAETALRAATENRLRLLESQLEPHMLFNTLANLRVLIGTDPARAQAMLDRLIAFLRATLDASRAPLQPLHAEFGRVADYLALMAVRMGARLQVRLDLPAELRDVPVPPLLLQPLVENAIKHGIEPQVAGGRLEVQALRDGAQLVLRVRDTGAGLAQSASASGSGFGTLQVRERLQALYGSGAGLTLAAADDADGGTVATIRLPLTAGVQP